MKRTDMVMVLTVERGGAAVLKGVFSLNIHLVMCLIFVHVNRWISLGFKGEGYNFRPLLAPNGIAKIMF